MAAGAVHSAPRVWRLPTPSPAVAYAIRFGVAVSAAIWLGKAPGLIENNSSWILITVLMVTLPTTGSSMLKAILRAAGTIVAAFTAILLFGLFAQDPPLLMAGLFLVQAVGAYGFSGQRFQYAWFVFAFTTAIVLVDAMAGQGAVETVAFQRASMVGLGILIAFVVDSLFWPTRAEPSLRESLAGRARALGEALRQAAESLAGPPSAVPHPAPAGPSPLASQLGLVAAARSELGSSRATLDSLAHVAILLEALASRARVLNVPLQTPPDRERHDASFAEAVTGLARRVEAALAEIAAAVSASRAPRPFSDDLERALLAFASEKDRLLGRVGPSEALEGRSAELRDIAAVLRRMEGELSSTVGDAPAVQAPSRPRFRPDPLRTKIALRAGLAVIAAFLAHLALGWPLNSLVAPIAFMVAAMTRGAAAQALTLLSGIVALGWLLADLTSITFTPHVGRAPLALAAPFAIATVFAYIAALRPQLALLPSIGGLIALLSVFGGTGAPTDVYGPYSTVCYLALALGIGWLFGRGLWPATAAGLLRQRLAAQLELCLEAARESREPDESGRGGRVVQRIQAFAEQSAQLGPLHQQALHEPVERALDPPRRARILALATDLMDAVAGDRPAALDPVLERGGASLRPLLEALRRADQALLDSMQAATDALRGETDARPSDLEAANRAFEERLEALRADPGRIPELSEAERRRTLVEIDARRRLVFRQRDIEDWLDEWQRAAQARSRPARTLKAI